MKQLTDTQFFASLYINYSIRKNGGKRVINRNTNETSLVCDDNPGRYSRRCRFSKTVQDITLNLRRGQKIYSIGSVIVVYGGTVSRNTPKQCMIVAQDGRTSVKLVEGWIFKGAVAAGSKSVAIKAISSQRNQMADRIMTERREFAQYEHPMAIVSRFRNDHSGDWNVADNIFFERGDKDAWASISLKKTKAYGKCIIVTIRENDTLKYVDGKILVLHEGEALLRKRGCRVEYIPTSYRDYHKSCWLDAVYYRGRVRSIGGHDSYERVLDKIKTEVDAELAAFKACRKFGIPFGHEELGCISAVKYPNLTAERAHDIAMEKWGVDVPVELFQHNIDAWRGDYKSEACDDTFAVFTPCGCNPLKFYVSYNISGRESYIC